MPHCYLIYRQLGVQGLRHRGLGSPHLPPPCRLDRGPLGTCSLRPVRKSVDEICVLLFADNPVKGRCNKELVQRIRRGIALVKRSDNLSIGWTKAHLTATNLEALGDAAADR